MSREVYQNIMGFWKSILIKIFLPLKQLCFYKTKLLFTLNMQKAVTIHVTAFQKKKSARRDSNPRPSPWQGDTPPLSHSRIISNIQFTAGDGNRTHVSSLEGWCSTIELHPRAQNRNRTSDTRIFSPLLYRLSYLGISATATML